MSSEAGTSSTECEEKCKLWDNDNIIKLIDEYRKHKVLWDVSDSNYKNKAMKDRAYEEIAESMGFDTNEIMRKLRVIYAQFRRERFKAIAKRKAGMNSEQILQSSWFGFKYLTFLLDNFMEDNKYDADNSFEEKHICDVSETQETERIEAPSPSESRFAYKTPNRNTVPNFRDECTIYGEYVVCKLRKLDSITRTIVEHKINSILYEAEMKMLSEPVQNGAGADPIKIEAGPPSPAMVIFHAELKN